MNQAHCNERRQHPKGGAVIKLQDLGKERNLGETVF